jgi:hypothetical protein
VEDDLPTPVEQMPDETAELVHGLVGVVAGAVGDEGGEWGEGQDCELRGGDFHGRVNLKRRQNLRLREDAA